MREREEEMERMREHVFGESDLNKDRLISFEEFLAETKRDEFEKDLGKSMEFLTILLHILKSLIHMINLAQKTPPDLKCQYNKVETTKKNNFETYFWCATYWLISVIFKLLLKLNTITTQ